ncbi:MAG: lipoate--protein ligase family protein [Luteitalea sp.]|nr:lipoate--protein ligase family protein [Luteitalea sp.]
MPTPDSRFPTQLLRDQPDLSPPDQLAHDWTLFRAAEDGSASETLRFWETIHPAVVVGRGGRISDEVRDQTCTADGVPILRRCSGGGAVVLGPGSLNYALVLSLVQRPELVDVRRSYRIILGRLAEALAVPNLTFSGTSDLALGTRKVSGNAQRRGTRALLHHGTLLYAFDPRLSERYLKEPRRQPPYRGRRPHADFLTNLPLSAAAIRERITRAWL